MWSGIDAEWNIANPDSDVSNETIEEAMPTAVNYAQYEQEIQIADNSDA
jgi:hypothetical protein